MKVTTLQKVEGNSGDTKVSIKVEYPESSKENPVFKKAKDFVNWTMQPNQTELDLSTTPQVTMQTVTMRVDKPKKNSSKIALGVVADKISPEDQSTLYNLFQGNKKVHIIVRQIPEPKKVKDAKETGETKNTELEGSTAEKK